MNKSLRIILQYIFFLGLGIFLTWLSLKGLNKENIAQIKLSLRNARYWLIIPVFIILFSSHYIRALRWRLLIEPLGYFPSRANTFFAVMIGYLANQAFPRLGEVLKCTVLARYEKIPADKLIGTIILERLIDAITLLVIFGITLAIQPQLYSQLIGAFFNPAEKGSEDTGSIPVWLIAIIVIGIIILIIALWMYKKKKNMADLVHVFKKIWQSIIQGITAIRHLKKRRSFIILTVLLWTAYVFGGYLGFMALQETSHYGIREAFTVLSAGSIGMIATPGGIGAYAYMIKGTMELYGLNSIIALAFGWILWLAQTTVILIGGLLSFAALPYYNKKKILGEQSDLIPGKIFTAGQIVQKAAQWRLTGKKISFTNGVFDILHQGHIFSLSQAAKEADYLIVGLNADASVKRLKGENRPVNKQDSRALVLASMVIVDAVVLFEEDTPLELIKSIMPDVLVKGGDYTLEQIAGAKEVIANGGRVVINPVLDGFSTTDIIEQAKKG